MVKLVYKQSLQIFKILHHRDSGTQAHQGYDPHQYEGGNNDSIKSYCVKTADFSDVL